ncbi:MAG: class I SAM-dependent methyltransferase [Patescibacteria group bacterium]
MESTSALLISSIVLCIAIALSLVALAVLAVLLYTKVPFVRTPKQAIDRILREIVINREDTVYDLGCGNARFLLEVEKRTGAQAIGFELSPWAYVLAKLNVLFRRSNVQVRYGDFYRGNINDADIIFCFLIDSVMPKVQQLLERQLKPGTIVISFAFPITAWKPIKKFPSRQNDPKSSKIYIYQR